MIYLNKVYMYTDYQEIKQNSWKTQGQDIRKILLLLHENT